MCEALWYWVVKEVGQVFSPSNDIESTVACRFKQGVWRGLAEQWNAAVPSSSTMEEVLYGSVWNMISLLLTTDDVVKTRTTTYRWNVGDSCGLYGDTILWMSKKEQFEKNWHYDPQRRSVHTMLRLRSPIMEGIRRIGLHPPQEDTLPDPRPSRSYDFL